MEQKESEDLLIPRRREFSNWLWTSRALNSKAAVKMCPRPSPKLHMDSVLKTPKISELIEEISRKESVKKEKVEEEVILILNEIGYSKNLQLLRWLGYVLIKILLKVSSGIFVNYKGLLQIKSSMGRCPVVFVPSHRSYADFILFSYVCFHYDLEIPAIAAGMDFQGMMVMGEMLRHTGAFFMRRSYNNDTLYWSTFKEYVHQLVCKGDLPLEFFIEGTRSRSNKSIAPKYGLMNMILKSYFLREVPDIAFVPVSINYDRILEESLFAFELLGIPKPKESTAGLFKSLKILKENFGDVHFHFGEPISSRSFFADKLSRPQHGFGPIHIHETTEEEKQVIPPLAFEIIRQQQLCCVLNSFNLIALTLNKNITRDQQLTSLPELVSDIRMLRSILKSWGARIFEEDVEESIKKCLSVHSNLIAMNGDQQVSLVTNKIHLGSLNPAKLKAHSLSENTMSYSVPFIMLQIYANPVLHYLVDAALIVVTLRSCGKMCKDVLFRHFSLLRAIFSYEFVLWESRYKMQFEEALGRLTSEKIIIFTGDQFDVSESNFLEEVLISSIQPFILTYYVVTENLQRLPEIVDEKTVLASVQQILESAINEEKIFIHPYCMSLDSLGNCLMSLTKMNVLRKNRNDGKHVYSVNRNAVRKVRSDLEIYIPSFHVIKSFDIFLHLRSKM